MSNNEQPAAEANDGYVMGIKLSKWQKSMLDLGLDSFKGMVPAYNDTMGRIMTLNVALIGGGFAAAKADVIPQIWSIFVLIALGTSLGFALWGISPQRQPIDYGNPDMIEAAEVATVLRKANAMNRSMIALFVAFLIAVSSVAYTQVASNLQ